MYKSHNFYGCSKESYRNLFIHEIDSFSCAHTHTLTLTVHTFYIWNTIFSIYRSSHTWISQKNILFMFAWSYISSHAHSFHYSRNKSTPPNSLSFSEFLHMVHSSSFSFDRPLSIRIRFYLWPSESFKLSLFFFGIVSIFYGDRTENSLRFGPKWLHIMTNMIVYETSNIRWNYKNKSPL